MSTKLTGYVWDGCAASGMKLSSVAIMARLADFSNDEGVCWPSIETIARQIGAGMSTVRTAIGRLEAEGWLTEMNDTSGRWSYARQLYGHVYTAKTGTLSELVNAGDQFNQQHITLAGYEKETQTPADELAASRTARAAVFIRNDPARPTQTGELVGMLPAPKGKRFTMTEQQTLLSHGVATAYVESGVLRIQRDVTTYRKNAYGVADNSYLDSETLHTSAYVLRKLKSVITSKYGRHKLASDGIAPPDIPVGFVAVFNSDEASWHLVEDHRGKTVYDVASGDSLFISELGPLPENITWLSPEGEFQKWNGTAWVKDTEAEKLFRIREAEETKNSLMQVASEHIAPLQDAADLEIATEEETSLLEAWKKYRVLLNRVDTSTAPDIEWPAIPVME